MITKHHTDIEKRDELLKDRFELIIYGHAVVKRKEYVRGYKKAKRFPYYYETHYKSKTGNRYVVTLTATDNKKGAINPIMSYFTTMDTDEGKYMFRYAVIQNVITMFTPHFLKRYRQRYLKNDNMSVDEVMRTFDRNNKVKSRPDLNTEGVWIGRDGYFIGKSVDNLDICVTYVPFDMLRENQLDNAERGLENLKKFMRVEIDI